MTAERIYVELLRRAATDHNALGVVLTGSRAVGAFVTERSDYDVYVILQQDADGWDTPPGAGVEVWSMNIDAFRQHALVGSGAERDRPSFLCARVELDKLEGEVALITERKRRLDPAEAERVARDSLDAYIYALSRSLKNLEAGRKFEGHLEAIESIPPLLTSAFALEGRVRPFNKWLRHEVAQRPIAVPRLLERVARIASDADPRTQRQVFGTIEIRARHMRLASAIDAWQRELPRLRGTGDGRSSADQSS